MSRPNINSIKEFLHTRIDKKIVLIDRIGAESHVTLVAVGDSHFTIRRPWGSLANIDYLDEDYDIK